MEHSRLSWRSLSLAALLHVLLLFLLFYVTQEEMPFFTARHEQEPSVVFLPSQPPPFIAQQAAQFIAHPTTQAQSTEEKTKSEPDFAHPGLPARRASTGREEPTQTWSSERARQAWRKKTPPTPAASPNKKASTTYQEDLMHEIIEDIPFEEKSAPLKQRIEAQFIKDGQEHFQYGTIKAICYELNKQKIMEASINLPRKIIFKITIERNGTLLNIEFTEPSYSESFNAAFIHAIQRASPFRAVPQSIPGDPVTLTFTLFHDQSSVQNSTVPAPITFYMN